MADWLPELHDDDLGTLIEALEAWESKDDSGEIIGELFESILAGRDPQAKAQFEAVRNADKQKRVRAKANRKERSVLLRAKLLTLRDRRRVERVVPPPSAESE